MASDAAARSPVATPSPFDPNTATAQQLAAELQRLELALRTGVHVQPEAVRDLVQWHVLKRLRELEARADRLTGPEVIAAVADCCQVRLAVPPWLCDAFVLRFHKGRRRRDGWAAPEAFGDIRKPGAHLAAKRERELGGRALWTALADFRRLHPELPDAAFWELFRRRELQPRGAAVSPKIVESVRGLGIGKTAARKWLAEEEAKRGTVPERQHRGVIKRRLK